MTTWFAQNSGVNIDSVSQWNSAANGSGSWLTWASLGASDVLVANGKTLIAMNVNFTCAAVTNLATGGTAGGSFVLNSGVTVMATLSSGNATMVTKSSSSSSSVIGNVTSSDSICVLTTGTGDISITGNITSGSAIAVRHESSGSVSVTGSITAGTAIGLAMIGGASLTVTGNITAGTSGNSHGVQLNGSQTMTVTGTVTSGSGAGAGVNAISSALIVVNGGVSTGNGTNCGVASPWLVTVNGNVTSNANGYVGVNAVRLLVHATNQLAHTYRINTSGSPGISRSLYTGGTNIGQPSQVNVRSGTTFGAASEYTGTLAVPSPTLVAIGVQTDNTVGSYAPAGGLDEGDLHDALDSYANKNDWKATGFATPANLPADFETLTITDGKVNAVLDSATTAALVDLIWDEPLTAATHNVATSSGKRLRQTTAFQQIDSTVIDAAATTNTFATGLDSAVDDFYNDSMLVFTDGALAGQVRAIYDYVGATKTIILEEALTSAPVNGVAFAIVSLHIHPVGQIQSGLATASALATQAAKINKIEAVATGTVTGAGTSTEVFVGPSATLTITVDASGNRSAVVVT